MSPTTASTANPQAFFSSAELEVAHAAETALAAELGCLGGQLKTKLPIKS
jgi:hypothetical protein